MSKLHLVWIVAVALIVMLSLGHRGESTKFFGIAETREIVINSENPVELKRMLVVAGQEIREGDLLVELDRPGLTLQQTFDIYVRAIQDRDLDALMTTVTDGSDFVFLTSSGRVIDSRAGYRQFHVDWFAEESWTIVFDMLELREGVEYGYVLTKYHYEGRDREGEPYESDSYFTLIFHREDGMWKVVQDQITPIRE